MAEFPSKFCFQSTTDFSKEINHVTEFLKSIQFKLMKYFIVHNKSDIFKKTFPGPDICRTT